MTRPISVTELFVALGLVARDKPLLVNVQVEAEVAESDGYQRVQDRSANTPQIISIPFELFKK